MPLLFIPLETSCKTARGILHKGYIKLQFKHVHIEIEFMLAGVMSHESVLY